MKVQRFCLTLLGEARLWYQSLEPINLDWQGLQNLFRQQYSKIGNSREHLFHTWRSFTFDENTGTIDTNVTCIRQVGSTFRLLGTTNLRSIHEHTPHNIILDSVSYRRPQTSGRNS